MKTIKDLTVVTIKEDRITDFAAVRNKELAKVKTDWVLFLDSDEKVSPELEAEIREAILNPNLGAYRLPRLDTFLGRELKYGENGKNFLVRLARKGWGSWVRPVHEKWVGEGTVHSLKNPLLHTPHTSISNFLTKINNYSTLEAQYRHSINIKSSLTRIAFFPLAKFLKNYLLLQGFRDGVPGTIMAVMMSFHSFLTWTKLYLLWQKD